MPLRDAVARDDGTEPEMTISRTIVHQVVDRQDAILTSDATLDERFNPAASVIRQHIRRRMCAPMSTKAACSASCTSIACRRRDVPEG